MMMGTLPVVGPWFHVKQYFWHSKHAQSDSQGERRSEQSKAGSFSSYTLVSAELIRESISNS